MSTLITTNIQGIRKCVYDANTTACDYIDSSGVIIP